MALTLTDEQETSIREALGLAEDADAAAIVTAVEDLATTPEGDGGNAPAAAAASAPASASVISIDREVLASLESRASRGDAAMARQEQEDRERIVDAALSVGKITPARRDHWLTLLSADREGTTAILDGLPKELAVPLSEVGHGQGADVAASAPVSEDETYKNWSI